MTGETTYAVLAGGGTAGHVLPGLAIANALVDSGHAASEIHFVGSERGLEQRLVPAAGYGLTVLPGRGIQRRITLANLAAVWGILVGVVKGIGLIRRLRPRVVVVLGGYASVPCLVGAVLWRVPLVVAEQNARAGAADRLAGRFAKACAVPFPETDLPRKEITGNPVRAELLAVDRERDRNPARHELDLPADRTVLAVFAGSLGSRRINDAVLAAVPAWSGRSDLAIRHVIGSRDWDDLRSRLPDLGPDGVMAGGLMYQAIQYEDRMDLLLAAADVALTRAGGTTVAELAELGLPAVLVPLPIAPRDHQTANAQALVRSGAAVLVADGDLTGERLVSELTPLLDDRARLRTMGEAAAALARPDAAAEVARLVERHARA